MISRASRNAEARSLILYRSSDPQFGMRPRRPAMEAELVDPLSRLIASRRLMPGDIVEWSAP